MIERREMITREMLRQEPGTLFVFGDNIVRKGLGGQAREMRGEPNAVGIPTKMFPGRKEEDYFRPGQFETWRELCIQDWNRLFIHAKQGGKIVIPAAGIGTGLAQLEQRCPEIAAAIAKGFEVLADIEPVQPERTPAAEPSFD